MYDDLFWKISYSDIRVKIRVFLGHQQALIVQNFETLAEIVSSAFGEGETEREKTIRTAQKPQNLAELQLAVNKVFGSK